MPLMAPRFLVCFLLVAFGAISVFAQTWPNGLPAPSAIAASTPPANTPPAPTSGEVMRGRVAKAKAYVAVKNYTAAIYELEGIRRETSDPAVNSVAQVILMNCYLEQSDYKRAQTLLTEVFNNQKQGKANSNYFAVAGQTVKGARMMLERYRSLGLSVSDRNLPAEAVADLEKMRETVEMVVAQSKSLTDNKKLTADSLALMEEASNSRSGLARDDYDAKRWKDEVADARENLINSRSVVVDASGSQETATALADKTLATNIGPLPPKTEVGAPKIVPITSVPNAGQPKSEKIEAQKPIDKPAGQQTVITNVPKETPKLENTVAVNKPDVKTEPPANEDPKIEPENASRDRKVGKQDQSLLNENTQAKSEPKSEPINAEPQNNAPVTQTDSPLAVGSLLEYATQKVNPTYPPAARTMRTTGVVKIELMVNEEGVAEVQNISGPKMLVKAAEDAVKRWKFKPFVRDGQPIKATGYVNFNFAL